MARKIKKPVVVDVAAPLPTNLEVKPAFFGESLGSIDVPARVNTLNYGSNGGLNSLGLRFPNLNIVPLPYYYNNNGTIVVSDTLELCQKAYLRLPILRKSIELLVEFASSKIFLDGGNAESYDFFEKWLKRINIFKLRDMFFRELWRSGNIFLYRIDDATGEVAKTIKQVYGAAETKVSKTKVEIPLRYLLLNPMNVAVYGGLNFMNPVYFRMLNSFELAAMQKSSNQDDKEVFKSLPDSIKNYFDGNMTAQQVPLDAEKLHTVFYKKQDYEPFAVPMSYPFLDSIELKIAMQKADAVVSRTVEYIMLLVTNGAKKDEGGVNPASMAALQSLFKKEQIGRVLVSDYTTKAEFLIPDLNKVLGEEKYKVVNQDISDGLGGILFESGAGRAGGMAGKLKAFAQTVNNAQEIFLNEFLNVEIKRVSKLMGFKAYPTATMMAVDLDDQQQKLRIYAQLIQMGILTAKDGLDAIERDVLPDYEDLHTTQEEMKKDKDKGLFQPIAGGPYLQNQLVDKAGKNAMGLQDSSQEHAVKTQKMQQNHDAKHPAPVAPNIHISAPIDTVKGQPGRPAGVNTKHTNKRVSKAGEEIQYSAAKLIENTRLHSDLLNSVESEYKKFNKLDKLSDQNKQSIETTARLILQNETSDKWLKSVKSYIKKPVIGNQEIIAEIEELAIDNDINFDAAALLFHSKI